MMIFQLLSMLGVGGICHLLMTIVVLIVLIMVLDNNTSKYLRTTHAFCDYPLRVLLSTLTQTLHLVKMWSWGMIGNLDMIPQS